MLDRLLGGRYRVIKALGEGGLAKTYIAEDYHRPGHPKCAVKFLKPASNDPNFFPTARRLFQKEAEILEKLGHHDRIPQSFAYFEENQEFYLVQEFIEGHTLGMELPRDRCWSESQVIQMLQDVLSTLKFVHSHGVIHRDIKPNNLIRRQQDERLVLIDFGAVKQIRTPTITNYGLITQKTIPIGTQGYMPTEQIRGKPRFNSDIYALGMICIQALTGIHPLYLQEDKDGEIVWSEQAKVSDELAAIITKMVRYHFKDRYQSTTEVLQALQSLASHDKLIQPTFDSRQLEVKVAPQPKNGEMKGSPDINPWEPWNLEITPEKKQRKPKVALEREQPTLKVVSNRVALEQEQPTLKVVRNKEEKVGLFSPKGSLASTRDLLLSLSPAPLFLLLNKSRLPIGLGIASVLVAIVASYTYITQRQSYLKVHEAIERIERLKVTERYQECIQQAETFLLDYTDFHAEAETLQDECQQYRAEKKLASARNWAEQSKFKEAIALAVQVNSDTIVYSKAQQLIFQWAEKIFPIASNQYQKGELEEAIALLEAIPASSTLANKARITINQWNREWKQNQTYLQAAQKSLDERLWQEALNTAQKISHNDYWQKQSEPIIQKAEAEIAIARDSSSHKTPSAPGKVATPTPSFHAPRRILKRSEPIPADAPFPISPFGLTSPGSDSSRPRSSSTEWICLNNPNPKCR